jgi:hypothetical protein
LSASPPCPGFLQICQMRPCDMKNKFTELSAAYELVRVADGRLVLVALPFLWPNFESVAFLGEIVDAYGVESGSVRCRILA